MTNQDPSDLDRLKKLEAKITAVRVAKEEKPARSDADFSRADMAWRMVIELVAGLMIGFGIGYGLDALFGTSPFLMILFILLGFAGGINVMLRTAKEMQNEKTAGAVAEEEERSGR